MIEANGVIKSYGLGGSKTDVLKGIDLQISDGDFAVILGASGSGKSTLLNCLSGLERVDGGSIEYDGLNIAELSDKALTKLRKENIGFIFQQYYLLPDMTVDKNVRMGADLAGNSDYREIIKAVGLEAKAAKYPSELSGGEQQRVSVARALAKKPKVLFLDEPTGALDEKTGRQVLDYMLKRDTPARLIAFAISTMFLPAITEESFYRKSIISFRSKPALVLSAVFGMLLYAAEHSLKPWGIFLTAIWALPLTISYIRTKNVYVPMTAHFIVNVFGNGVTVIMTIVAMCK